VTKSSGSKKRKPPAADVVDVVAKPRPTKRTPEIVDAIIEAVSNGEPLAPAVRSHGVGLTTWYDWCKADPELAERIARAREAGEDIIAADTLRIVDEPPPITPMGTTDSGHVAWAKSRAEARLKLLAKWNPKKWGDKIELGGTVATVVSVKDFTGRSDG
jgi:hypothetical protein